MSRAPIADSGRGELTMRIALLSYRSKTHCGGQGVYVRHLSRGLVELGHDVEVFSGQPYPEGLDPRVRLTEVPSLDLYREPDPFRVPRPSELHDRIDVLELLDDVDGRPSRSRRRSACAWPGSSAERRDEFDVVHDNQSLGTALLDIAKLGLPVVATVHHPITRDRVLDVAAAKWWRKPLVRRWYGFAEMQKQVARKIPELLTVSSTSATDIAEDFGVSPDQLHVVPLGVDTELFKPAEHRVRNRIIAIASADVPLKGVSHLLHAVARLRVERDLDVQLVSKLEPNGPTEKLIAELGISDIVHSSSGLSDAELAAPAGVGRGGLHPVAVRGLLAARRRGDGQRHADRGQPRGRAARGGRHRRRVRPAGSSRRRRRTDRGARRTARLPAGAAHGSVPRAAAALSTCSAGNPWRRRRYRCTTSVRDRNRTTTC